LIRTAVRRGCLLVNVFIVVATLLSCYLSTIGFSEDSFLPPPMAFVALLGAFVFLMTTAFYVVWTTFIDKARPQPVKQSKSQFLFTNDGEIIEVLDDEKRKRGADSTVE
jgi:hypothetical protein